MSNKLVNAALAGLLTASVMTAGAAFAEGDKAKCKGMDMSAEKANCKGMDMSDEKASCKGKDADEKASCKGAAE